MFGWALPWRRGSSAEHVDQRADARLDQADARRGRSLAATVKRGQCPDRAFEARDEVEQRHAGLRRRPVGIAGDGHQPADRLGEQVVGRSVRIGAGEAAHGGDHHARMARAERIGLEPQVGGGRRAVVVHEQVGRGEEPVEGDAAVIGAQVEDDPALVAVDRREVGTAAVGRVAPPWRAPGAGLVARRRLDLDDVGAEVGEEHGGERAGQHPAEVDDPDAVERERLDHAGTVVEALARSPLG